MATRYLLLAMAGWASAQTSNANFNQVINLNGDMNLNSITFPDGSRVEAFSQTQRQLLVNQNQAPLPGNQVTGSTGNPFMQLSTSSLIIQTNGGIDLVGAQIELPINNQMLQQNNIAPDNTYVAKLAPDRRSWMIMETIKSVNGSDNTVRLVKMNNIDGEYIALGRQTRETSLSLTQFSTNLQQGFNVSGSGIQENEFTDGFRMSVRSTQPMLINTNVVNGVSSTMMAALGPRVLSVNNYRYLVNTNLGGVVPNINRMVAVVQLPINPIRLQTVAKNQGANPNSIIRLSIAQRGILANPGGAQSISGGLNRRQDNNNNNNNGQNSNGQNNNGNNNNGQNNNGQNNNGNNNNGQNNNGNNGNNNNNNNGQNNNGNNGNLNGGTQTNNPAATRLLLSPTFTPIAANAVLDQMNGRLAIPVSQLDGEFIITVENMDGQNGGNTNAGQQIQGQQGSQQGTTISNEPNGQQTQQGSQQQQGTQTQGNQGQQGVQSEPQQQGATSAAPQVTSSAAPAAEPQASSQAPQAESPAAAPQGSASAAPPAAAAPAPPAAAPAAGTAPAAPAPAAPGVAAPAPPAPAASGSSITRPIKKRQLAGGVPFAATPQQPAPVAPKNNGVMVSMAWINMMAKINVEGLPVNVGGMMDEFMREQGIPAAGSDPLASLGL